VAIYTHPLYQEFLQAKFSVEYRAELGIDLPTVGRLPSVGPFQRENVSVFRIAELSLEEVARTAFKTLTDHAGPVKLYDSS